MTQENPVSVLNDINGIRNVLEFARTRVWEGLYASSSEVYGEPVVIPQHEETTPLNSRVPYAVVKNIGEAFRDRTTSSTDWITRFSDSSTIRAPAE